MEPSQLCANICRGAAKDKRHRDATLDGEVATRGSGTNRDLEEAKEAAQAETDQVLAGLSAKPASVTVTAVHGLPADELVKASQGADMLVLSRRGSGGFARLLIGSVTGQVAEHAACPVLIVPQAE